MLVPGQQEKYSLLSEKEAEWVSENRFVDFFHVIHFDDVFMIMPPDLVLSLQLIPVRIALWI